MIAAAFLITAGAGIWNEETGDKIPGVTIGIVALGYVLFGIMHRPMLAAVGAGIAAAYYIPYHLAGDAALAVSGAATLTVALLGGVWAHKSGTL